MQSKTTRAFRTISEAAEELDLQPHVLRFWESKFPNFKPIKRGGGRRFYRPEDIEFLRGIKILLHDERHPIKDVQKLIRVKGAARVSELGRSIKKAAIQKDVKDTVLVPDHIQGVPAKSSEDKKSDISEFSDDKFFPEGDSADIPAEDISQDIPDYAVNASQAEEQAQHEAESVSARSSRSVLGSIHSIDPVPTGLTDAERSELELAVSRLRDLRKQWQEFKQDTPPQ